MVLRRSDRHFICRGKDPVDGRSVVVKTTAPDAIPEVVAALRHEHEVLKGLAIPGVVRARRLVRLGDELSLVLEDVGGRSLREVLAEGPLPLATFLDLAARIVAIVAALHAAHVIHRDLNPSNVALDAGGTRPTLIDFGMATSVVTAAAVDRSPWELEGTLPYMSPEQTGRTGRSVDHRTDLYALGATFYEMLAGHPPFASSDPVALVHAHLALPPPPLGDLVPDLPPAVAAMVHRLLAKDPETRYQTAQGLAHDLRTAQEYLLSGGTVPGFALGRADHPRELRVPETLFGREASLAALAEALSGACGPGPALVLVTGEAGVGKTTTVAHGLAAAAREGAIGAVGRFEQLRRDVPYAGVAQAIGQVARQLMTAPEDVLAAWRARVQAAIAPNGAVVAAVVPPLAELLGPQPEAPALAPLEARNRFNLTFSRLVGAMATPDAPLTIFLDDLQWADPASLALVAHLAADADVACLRIVGAYREADVGPDHPLAQALEELDRAGVARRTIALAPLTRDDVGRLLAETLDRPAGEVAALAATLHRRTGGNPLFVRRLLAGLAEAGALWFDDDAGAWRWEAGAVDRVGAAADLVQLFRDDIQRIPAGSRELLRLAAGVGHQVDLGLLAAVAGRSRAEAAGELWPAVEQGLLQPVRAADRAPMEAGPLDDRLEDLRVTYQFANDRVRQAAYALLPAAERPGLHLRIGRLMLADVSLGPQRLFDAADQLNAGASLIADPAERFEVARLDLAAARRAQASAAYASAQAFAEKGLAVMPPEAWSAEPALAFELRRLAAEAAYLAGDGPAGDAHVAHALPHAPTPEAAAGLHDLRVVAASAQGAWAEALARGREGLAVLGLALPAIATPEALQAELDGIEAARAGRGIDALLDAPEADDPAIRTAMRLLSDMYVPAYVADPAMMALQIARMVHLTFRHGRTPHAAEAYAQFALLSLGGPRPAADDMAYAFGRLATDLARRDGNPACVAKVLTVVGGTLGHWRAPVRAAEPMLREAFAAGIEGGEVQYAAYASSALVYALFDGGAPLDEVLREIDRGAAFAPKAGNKLVADILDAYRQAVLHLRGEPGAPAPAEPPPADAPTTAFLRAVLGLRLAYLAGDLEAAARHAAEARAREGAGKGLFATADLAFFEALALAARRSDAPPAEQADLDAALAAHAARLEAWASHAPANFRHKARLVAAERARLEGRAWDALAAYEAAIDGAQAEGFLHDEALALELAGRFCARQGHRRLARPLIRAAAAAYGRWGARARVDALELAFPGWTGSSGEGGGRKAGDIRSTTIGSSGSRRLDAISLLKAAQTLSGETVIDKMIATMMGIAIEAAGATRGVLLLEEQGKLQVRARGTAGPHGGVTLSREPLEDAADLPRSILRYAWRTGSTLVVDNAMRDPLFAPDPAVAQGLRSVLCVPIADQGRARGLLYVDNDQLIGAFGPERGEVLRLLAAQMAISLDNALMVTDLKQASVVIENSPIVLVRWKFSEDMGVEYISENVERVLGYRREDLLSGAVTFDKLIHPDDWERILGEYGRALASGEDRFAYAYRAVTPAGEERWIEATSTFERDEAGVPRYLQGVLADVTDRKRAEAERTASLLREQAARAEVEAARELDRLKTGFVNAVSHDLRTPLTSIIGYAEFLEDELGGPLSDQQKAFVAQIQKSTRRLEGLVADLLDVARLDAGTFTLKPEEADLAAKVAETLESFHPQAQAAGVRLEPDLPAGPLLVTMDVARVERVLANLVGNALKFTPRDGTITVRVRADADRARCEVTDTGPGIAAEDLPKLFQRFVQLEEGARKGGTGLGLSISKAIVEAHGGEIGVESGPVQGSAFWFTLPLRGPGG